MVVEQAPAVNGDLVQGGVFADEVEGFGEVLGVAVDPLALVAALGDGVELLGRKSRLGRTELLAHVDGQMLGNVVSMTYRAGIHGLFQVGTRSAFRNGTRCFALVLRRSD